MPHARTVSRLVLAAALGILTTIAIAWFCAIRLSEAGGVPVALYHGDIGRGRLTVCRYNRSGFREVEVTAANSAPEPADPGLAPADALTMPPERRLLLSGVPRRARSLLTPWGWDSPPPPDSYSSRKWRAFGWPRPSLWCAFDTPSTWRAPERILVGLKVPETGFVADLIDRGQPPVTLPTRPIWPNLLLDAVLFTAPWYLALTAPGVVRRAFRRRRGLCASCAYDLRGLPTGSPCPECGRKGPPVD